MAVFERVERYFTCMKSEYEDNYLRVQFYETESEALEEAKTLCDEDDREVYVVRATVCKRVRMVSDPVTVEECYVFPEVSNDE